MMPGALNWLADLLVLLKNRYLISQASQPVGHITASDAGASNCDIVQLRAFLCIKAVHYGIVFA